ncbi:hypothetical protein TW95_gp1694 [Pandoravirus inopinatum]|uniref:Uncharacterized protein n=1 Tax=Pandoravirus inopinatum TaxID=1605721 RepID=A0A0B5IZQ8_9VIRU|nr:hypothetical protein TW95_gp1694 [Pandoravirus inopinatum]AJF98428.1 hypothetical protein [Pandoravirus inopinatum]
MLTDTSNFFRRATASAPTSTTTNEHQTTIFPTFFVNLFLSLFVWPPRPPLCVAPARRFFFKEQRASLVAATWGRAGRGHTKPWHCLYNFFLKKKVKRENKNKGEKRGRRKEGASRASPQSACASGMPAAHEQRARPRAGATRQRPRQKVTDGGPTAAAASAMASISVASNVRAR